MCRNPFSEIAHCRWVAGDVTAISASGGASLAQAPRSATQAALKGKRASASASVAGAAIAAGPSIKSRGNSFITDDAFLNVLDAARGALIMADSASGGSSSMHEFSSGGAGAGAVDRDAAASTAVVGNWVMMARLPAKQKKWSIGAGAGAGAGPVWEAAAAAASAVASFAAGPGRGSRASAWCRVCEKQDREKRSMQCKACSDYCHSECLPASESTATAKGRKPWFCPVCQHSWHMHRPEGASVRGGFRDSAAASGASDREAYAAGVLAKGLRFSWAQTFTVREAELLAEVRVEQAQRSITAADAAVDKEQAVLAAADSAGEGGRMQVQAGPDPFGDPDNNRVLIHLTTGTRRSGRSGLAARTAWLTPSEAAESRRKQPDAHARKVWDMLNEHVLMSLGSGGSDVDSLRCDMWRHISKVQQHAGFVAEAQRTAAAARARLKQLTGASSTGTSSSSGSSRSSSGINAAASGSKGGVQSSNNCIDLSADADSDTVSDDDDDADDDDDDDDDGAVAGAGARKGRASASSPSAAVGSKRSRYDFEDAAQSAAARPKAKPGRRIGAVAARHSSSSSSAGAGSRQHTAKRGRRGGDSDSDE